MLLHEYDDELEDVKVVMIVFRMHLIHDEDVELIEVLMLEINLRH
jgi:hypothetical protein